MSSLRIQKVSVFNDFEFASNLELLHNTPYSHLDFFENDEIEKSESSAMTILLGQNGTGKSRIMRDIITFFDHVERRRNTLHARQARQNCLKSVTYSIDDDFFEISIDGSRKISVKSNGIPVDFAKVRLPKKIIASSASPFDKFPAPRTKSQSQKLGVEHGMYSYLGLRDRSGRASSSRAIMNTIENLAMVSSESQQRFVGIAEVFRFLGYLPKMELVYNLVSDPNRFVNFLDSELLQELASNETEEDNTNYRKYVSERLSSYKNPLSEYQARKIAIQLNSRKFSAFELEDALKSILYERRSSREINFGLDFERSAKNDFLFSKLQILQKAGIVRLKQVECYKEDGTRIDFKDVSSGESAIALAFIGIASVIEKGSLILIDEPEISLHPAWQDRFLNLLQSSFEKYYGCHFVIATHSPLILSDIKPKNSHAVILGSNRDLDTKELAGASVDELLITAFDVTEGNNSYLKQQISLALSLIREGKFEDEKFHELVSELKQIGEKMNRGHPAYSLVENIVAMTKTS